MGPYSIMAAAWLFCGVWIGFVVMTNKKVHPAALFHLFFIEMWERFSYYGMRALLVLFMTKGFLTYSQTEAYGAYGAYGALVYATPLIGGLLSEKFLGYRKAIMWGALLMMCGQFLLMIENEYMFLTALTLLIIGNGFFKPNISSMIGKFYAKNDPRRDGAFTIFYMGINIGAFLTGLTCGVIGELHGWGYGFATAGFGMMLGLFLFWNAIRIGILGDKGYAPYQVRELKAGETRTTTTSGSEDILDDATTTTTTTTTAATAAADEDSRVPEYELLADAVEPKYFGVPVSLLIFALSLVSIPMFWVLISHNEILDYVLLAIGGSMIGYLLINSFQYEQVQRERIWVIVTLFLFAIIFWTFFELAGSALTVFTDKNVDKPSYLTTTMFQSFNPFFIMLFAPVFSWIWVKLSNANIEPAAPVKFGVALILLGLGFLVLGIAPSTAGMIPATFMIFAYLLHTLGELALSPVGLSMVTKLAPAQVVGFVMGFWMMSSAFAHMAGKHIANLTAVDENTSIEETLTICLNIFSNLGYIAMAAGGILIAASYLVINKWMHGIK